MAIESLSNHTAYIMERGGRRRLHQITNLSEAKWSRVRDDTSEGSIKLNIESASDQRDILRDIAVGRHELCLFRNNRRVWEGPISLLATTATGVDIAAKDITWYLARTAMHQRWSSAFADGFGSEKVIARLMRILSTELLRKESLSVPYNILPNIVPHQSPLDAENSRITEAYQATIFEHMDDLAAKGGIDYTVIGRALHLWDTSRPAMGYTRRLTEADFLGELIVSVYGSELTTSAIVTDGQGGYGISGGIDDFYGEWETIATAYDEDEGGPVPSTEELESQAQRNRSARLPTPTMVRVPDNSSLNLSGTLTIDDLVPGVYVPLTANSNIRQISQMQKLNNVTVTETASGETITVSLYPASAEDVAEEDE